MAGSHIELRKRNERFAKGIGKRNPLNKVDPLDKKAPLNKWIIGALMFVVLGSIFFEVVQQVFTALFPPTQPTAKTNPFKTS